MKLSLFNGGLNIRQAPELIKPNEAIVCHNVDVQTGQIMSEQGLAVTSVTDVKKAFYFLTDEIWMGSADTRDYLEYQGKLYWTDGVLPKKYSAGITSDLGIAKPPSAPAVTGTSIPAPTVISAVLNGVGVLSGAYKYFYTYYDSATGIESLPSPITASLTTDLNQIDIKVTLSATPGVTSIRLYRSGGSVPTYTLAAALPNTTATHTDNIADSAVSGAAKEKLQGTIQYVYTYYNVDDGTESEPSMPSIEIAGDNGTIDITLTASPDPQVTHIELYRIGGTFTSFTKVTELPNTSVVFTDSVKDSDLAITLLTSELNGKPPAGLKYLTYRGGTFFGVVGTKLYFSHDIGNPNYWPETNYMEFRVPLTGIGIIAGGIIVFSRYDAFIVTGSNASTFIKYPLSGDQGCISHKSIALFGNSILFLSTDGICTATGAKVEVVSKYKLGKQLYNPVNAVVYDEEYLCQLTDNSIISLDMRYEPLIETYDFGTSWLAIAKDTLYGETGTGLFAMFRGAPVPYKYTTGNLTEGAVSELKLYNTVYVYLIGTHTIKVYINDVLVATRTLTGTTKPQKLTIPQEHQRGSSIRFELEGTGTVKEIEYMATRRVNE